MILGRNDCTPQVYLDGSVVNPPVRGAGGAEALEAVVTPADVGGIEVYPDPVTAPVQYTQPFNDCAVVLVWTKALVR